MGQPPKQWVDLGIVRKDVLWKLRRAVYGLRQSPKWWSDERDSRLRSLHFTVGSHDYYLQQNDADSQVWMLTRKSGGADQPSRETTRQPTNPLDGSRRRVGNPLIASSSKNAEELLGLLCVYVDDFLAVAPQGPIRDDLVRALTSLRKLGPERTFSL